MGWVTNNTIILQFWFYRNYIFLSIMCCPFFDINDKTFCSKNDIRSYKTLKELREL